MSHDIRTYNDVMLMFRRKAINRYSNENILSRFEEFEPDFGSDSFAYFSMLSELEGIFSIGVIPESDYVRITGRLNDLYNLRLNLEF